MEPSDMNFCFRPLSLSTGSSWGSKYQGLSLLPADEDSIVWTERCVTHASAERHSGCRYSLAAGSNAAVNFTHEFCSSVCFESFGVCTQGWNCWVMCSSGFALARNRHTLPQRLHHFTSALGIFPVLILALPAGVESVNLLVVFIFIFLIMANDTGHLFLGLLTGCTSPLGTRLLETQICHRPQSLHHH